MDMTIRHKSFCASPGFQQYSMHRDALIPLFSKLNMMTGRLGLQVKQVNNLCSQYNTVEPAYRYRSAIRLAPVARIFIRSVTFNLTVL